MSLQKFMASNKDGVFYPGHASALVRISGKLFLFDPIWNHQPYGKYWTFYPRQVNCDSILHKIQMCFVSHIHADHLCDKILKELKCPIVIMDGRPNLEDRLDHCLMIKPFTWAQISDGIEVYFVPHAFNTIDSSVFIRSKDFCVYVGSDNFLDEKLLKRIKPDIGRIDVAMVPYAFVHWYPFLMEIPEDEKIREIKRLNHQSLVQAETFVDVMRPLLTIPFGANLIYQGGWTHDLNKWLVDPKDFKGASDVRTGDFVLKGGRIYQSREVTWPGFTDLPPINPTDDVTREQMNDVALRVEQGKPVIGQRLIVNMLSIDLESLSVSIDRNLEPPYTRFLFDEKEFNQWASGEITFEQAIGTRRFTCQRVPNVYDVRVFEFMNNYL